MDDDLPRDDAARRAAGEPAPPPSEPRRPRKRRWGVILFGVFIILPI